LNIHWNLIVLSGHWSTCLVTLDSRPKLSANTAFFSRTVRSSIRLGRTSSMSTFGRNFRQRRNCTRFRHGKRWRSTWHRQRPLRRLQSHPAYCSSSLAVAAFGQGEPVYLFVGRFFISINIPSPTPGTGFEGNQSLIW